MKFCMKCMSQYEDKFNICPVCGFEEGTLPNDSRCLEPGSILADRFIVGMPLAIDSWLIRYIGWDALTNRKVTINEYCPIRYCTRTVGEVRLSVIKEKAFYRYMSVLFKKAQILSEMHLPDNIATIYEAFEKNNTAYVITEYTEGKTLSQYITEKGAMQIPAVEKMFLPVLRSLDKLHDSGFIVGGFTPDNILVTEENKLVLSDYLSNIFYNVTDNADDFKSSESDKYYPPERLEATDTIEVSPENDVFSASMIMQRMLGVTLPDPRSRKSFYAAKGKDSMKKPSAFKVKLDQGKENALINAAFIDTTYRTPDMDTFIKELSSGKGVQLRTKSGEKIPIWAKIAIPTAAVAVIVAGIIFIPMLFNANKTDDTMEGKTVVPGLVNYSLSDASDELKKVSLMLEIEGKEIDDYRDENLITAQSVARGTIVDENTVVGVTVSSHSGEFDMPNFLGIDVNSCVSVLEGIGMNYSLFKEYSSDVSAGCVVSQSITPYTKVKAGMRVDIVISAGPDPSAEQTEEPVETGELVGEPYSNVAGGSYDCASPVEVVDRVYDDSVPDGTIISQEPAAGTVQDSSEPVKVVVSTANKSAAVPDVELLAEDKAIALLEMYGFKADISYEDSDTVASGLVITQNPKSGETADVGETVGLTVSGGKNKVSVPETVGQSKDKASSMLHDAGFSVKYEYAPDSTKAPDEVLSQSVSAGTMAPVGSCIVLTICTNDELAEIPDLTGLDDEAAKLTLTKAGFTFGIYNDINNSLKKGVVAAQFPDAGMLAKKGVTVNVVLREQKSTSGEPEITITPAEVTMEKDETFVLDIKTVGIENLYEVEYFIDDENVVNVCYIDKKTLSMTFRALSPGKTKIKICWRDIEKVCSVTVNGEKAETPSADLFTISPQSASIGVKETFSLNIDAKAITDKKAIEYDISDTSVLEVAHINTKTLEMTFRGIKAGQADVTISYGSFKKVCHVKVG